MSKFEIEKVKDSSIYFVRNEFCSPLLNEDILQTLTQFFEKNTNIGFVCTDALVKYPDCSHVENILYSDALPEIPFFMRDISDIDLNRQSFTEIMINILQKGWRFSHIPIVGCQLNVS